jgi:hypothetical protein
MSNNRKKKEERKRKREQRQSQRPGGNGPTQRQPLSPPPPGRVNGMATAAAPAPPGMEHQFNGDMLVSEHDQQLAHEEYPEIYHVLNHPALRAEFLRYDGLANKSKLHVHRIGLAAVLLAALALLGSALTPVLRQIPGTPEWVFTVLLVAEVGGIVGVALAAGGVFFAKLKKHWLEARMMSEVLRLWHFQSFICRGRQIEASCDANNPGAVAAFEAERNRAFRVLMHEWEGSLDSQLTKMVEHPQAGYHLLHDEPTKWAPHCPVLDKIFRAYRSMRFRHQDNYATHKLQKHTAHPLRILKWPAALLQSRVQGFAGACLFGSLLCSFLIVLGHLAHVDIAGHIGWPAAIIVFLILTVASRAVQDGLAAPEDLQRYSDYAGKIGYLLGRFDTSTDPTEKLALMAEMERAALEELKGFLRAHSEARFVL